MSLRVLLADESASIKKVFQLGLQDFAADVKTVQSGVDVLEVAENFKPDIIFADILLQKKNGYEICKELKKHAELKTVPVVLMWSSFMELDPQKYKDSQAEGEMEKPFEVDAMRSHIRNLVERTKQQQLSSFLEFPNAIKEDFVQEFKEKEKTFSPPPAPPEAPVSVDGIEKPLPEPPEPEASFDEITHNSVFNQPLADFSAELETSNESQPPPPPVIEEAPPVPPPVDEATDNDFQLTHDEIAVEEWRTKPLTDQGIKAEEKAESSEDETEQFQSVELKADENLQLDDFLYKPEQPVEEESKPILEVRTNDYSEEDNLTPADTDKKSLHIDRSEIEAIVLAHAQEVIKLNIQEMLPKIIEKITREELDKLLKEELKMKS